MLLLIDESWCKLHCCFLSDTQQQSGPVGLSKPEGASDQAQLDNGTSRTPGESPASERMTEMPVRHAESEDTIRDAGVIQGDARNAHDDDMDDASPPADPGREDGSDGDKMTSVANTEIPPPTDADSDKANEEGVEEEGAIVEPSGEESSGLIGNEEEIEAVTDESSAAPGDPQSAVSGGGEDEVAGSAGEVNVGEPQDATGGEDLKNEESEEAREGEERARNTEHGADGEGNSVEETKGGEGEGEKEEHVKEGGDSVNDEKNDNTEGCRAGEVLDAEEPGEAAGGVSNDEEIDQDNVTDNVVGDGKESSSSLQPEAEESESK